MYRLQYRTLTFIWSAYIACHHRRHAGWPIDVKHSGGEMASLGRKYTKSIVCNYAVVVKDWYIIMSWRIDNNAGNG